MARKRDLKHLKSFKKMLAKDMPISAMYLFGSRAKGKFHKWSDFDLLIVSKEFKRKKSFERSIGLHKYWTIDAPVDFLCYTPEEFNKLKKGITIVRIVVKTGIKL